MNLAPYRFTYTPAANKETLVCIQKGTDCMSFTMYIQGRPNHKAIYRRLINMVGDCPPTFYEWCTMNDWVCRKWRKPFYNRLAALRDDALRLGLL